MTGGRGGIEGCGGGSGNQYIGKWPYKSGSGGHGALWGRGSSDKCVRFNDHGNPPHGFDWVEDKFYEQGFYAKFWEEQKTRLHELRHNRSTNPPAT